MQDYQNSFYMKLSYVPVIGLCSLFDQERNSNEELYFHSKQGLSLLISELFCSCCWTIPIIGKPLFLLLLAMFIGFHIKIIMEIKKGRRWKVPVIGHVAVLLEA